MMVVQNRLFDLMADKTKREHKKITIKDLAQACKISRQSASRWVNNRVKCYPVDTLESLCEFFNCDVSDLFVRKQGMQ